MTDVRVPDAAPHRRRRRGLAGQPDDADERAQRDRRRRRRRRPSARRRGQRRRRDVERRSTSRTARRRDKDRLMQLWVQAEVGRLTNMRAAAERPGRQPRPGDVDRQARPSPSSTRRSTTFCIDLLGADGAGRLRLHVPPARGPRRAAARRTACATRSCACGPTRSRAARRRSCATSSASRCSACPASRGSTRTCRGARCRAARTDPAAGAIGQRAARSGYWMPMATRRRSSGLIRWLWSSRPRSSSTQLTSPVNFFTE